MVFRRVWVWLIAYEVVCLVTCVVSGLLILHSGNARPVYSIKFIRSHSVLYDVVSIWLSNLSSFFLGGVLIALHPALGFLAVAFNSFFSGQMLASWLAGYCPTRHLIYGNIETQAYIILWFLIARSYVLQKECRDLNNRWIIALEGVKKILFSTFTIFLILSIIEVAEVITYG